MAEPSEHPTPAATPVDVQAQINQALQAQQTEFSRSLKEATGHGDIKALTEARLKEQGRLQELADAKAQEAQSYKTRFEQAHVNAALLAASADAVDPALIKDLLAGKALCDDDGNVTIDGKPAAEAVKDLLVNKPFLAKAQGGTGSGAPQQTQAASKNPWSAAEFNLTEQIRINKENPTLAAQLKAAAGK
ncbi:MAG: hypothetical protein Q7U98_17220 [Methylicorpusculum sp.]|uniref:hypothetical protein n=1 Tax=Methylicorpusculum sp. TaxID=2713644 RepID=UPI002719EAAF|nr:hypothetical protein [Methylicorpusculum sp.]MDO8940898.1 hypothetical protein [Methylicorpusculum sp.]MDP2202411.1 hypothetical protein [Methylicorpusculum sp.]